jgi:hypothetical protein
MIRRLLLSEEQCVRQLLMHEEMGDRRPTQFLRHLRTLAGPSVPSEFFRTLWTNRLPPNIQAIITTQGQVALDDVAQLADKIAEVTPPPSVARLSSSGVDICTLTARIDELTRQVAAVYADPSRPRSPSRIRRQARHPSRSEGRSPAPHICWYQRRFQERGSRKTRTAVASGGEQLQQITQPPLCDSSVHKDELLGRHRRRSLCLPPFPSSRPDTG